MMLTYCKLAFAVSFLQYLRNDRKYLRYFCVIRVNIFFGYLRTITVLHTPTRQNYSIPLIEYIAVTKTAKTN